MADPMRPTEEGPRGGAIARSPLGAESTEPRSVPALSVAALSAVAIRERPFVAQVDVRGLPTEGSLAAIERAVGVRPSASANRATGAVSGLRVLWLGPDEWLVVDPNRDPGDLESLVAAAVAPFGGSAVDLSAHRTILEVDGPATRDLLASACSIDLHPRAFGPGSCAQTTLARVDVVLDCLASDLVRILIRSSFAPYLVTWLRDALVEIEADADTPSVAPASDSPGSDLAGFSR